MAILCGQSAVGKGQRIWDSACDEICRIEVCVTKAEKSHFNMWNEAVLKNL